MKSLYSRSGIAGPAVFYVTDRRALPNRSSAAVLEKIRSAMIAQVDFVQIREKDLLAVDLLSVTIEAIRTAKEAAVRTRLIVNDRLDVALAAGASGVHLGMGSLPRRDVIEWCRAGNAPADFLVGVACHSVEDAREAGIAGASYVFFGPVFDTPSKRPFGPPQGLACLENVCRATEVPVIAIGGVNESNAADCIKAGASGIAAIRLFQDAQNANALASTLAGIHQIRLK